MIVKNKRFAQTTIVIPIIFALVLSLTFWGCGEKEKVIKIGSILPLTGDSADWGANGKYGIDLAVEEINQSGGVNGKKLEVVYEDSQADPKIAVSVVRKLISVNKVPAIVGDIVSATTLAMAPIVEKEQVVLVGISTSAPAITNAGEYTFRVWPSDTYEGTALAKFVYEKGDRKICILHIQNDYGVGLRDVFRKVFTDLGGQILADAGYAKDETDFKSRLTQFSSLRPDGIYLVSYYTDAALVLKQAAELGIKTQFFGATAVESPKLIELAGKAAEGLIYPIVSDFDPDNPNEKAKKFIANLKAKFNVEPHWASTHSYDAVYVIVEGMKRGGLTGSEIQKAMANIKGYIGVTSEITFDEFGDVINKPVTIRWVKDGKFVVYPK